MRQSFLPNIYYIIMMFEEDFDIMMQLEGMVAQPSVLYTYDG